METVRSPFEPGRRAVANSCAVLRLVDNKAILYFEASSTSDALTWFRGAFSVGPAVDSR
jgi:hypothetical protein